jgi:hypothetical protein
MWDKSLTQGESGHLIALPKGRLGKGWDYVRTPLGVALASNNRVDDPKRELAP